MASRLGLQKAAMHTCCRLSRINPAPSSQAEVERLGAKVAELDAEVESLRDSVSHLGESLTNALAGGRADGEAEPDADWLAIISEARGERDALAAEKAAVEQRAAQLEGRLSAAMADLEAAKVRGRRVE